MTTPHKNNAKRNADSIRDALGKTDRIRAEAMRLEHDAKGARDVAGAKTKAALAEAEAAITEKKREVEKQVDDALVNAHKAK
jgi:hypothetical protein